MSIGPTPCGAKFEHATFLAPFLLFNVILLALDIVTDILRGVDLIVRGYLFYGWATLSLIFVPTLASMFLRVAKNGVRFYNFRRPRLFLSKQKLRNFFWAFPLLLPLRFDSTRH